MQSEELTILISNLVPDQKPGISKQFAEYIIPAEKLREVCLELKQNPTTRFDYLFCLTASDRKDGFHIVYHMTSTTHGHSIVIRVVLTDKATASVQTVGDIWASAAYYEREVFDLFGIRFENHPDLRRLFLEDDWIGYPLRKDYKDSFTFER